jgi:hypothetical protein
MNTKRYLLVDALGHIHSADEPQEAVRNVRVMHVVDMRQRASVYKDKRFAIPVAPSPSKAEPVPA